MDNPFNLKTEEAKYHTWQSAFESNSRDDNPYTSQTDPELNAVWMQGWTANKNRTPPKRNKAIPTAADLDVPDLTEFSDYEKDKIIVSKPSPNKSLSELDDSVLMTELKNRKRKELEQLKAKNADLLDRINRLELFLEL